jgi:hypothetical protein
MENDEHIQIHVYGKLMAYKIRSKHYANIHFTSKQAIQAYQRYIFR